MRAGSSRSWPSSRASSCGRARAARTGGSCALGIEFATVAGDPFCRLGSSAIAVLRVDPHRVRLRVRHYTQMRLGRPLSVLEWQGLTHALAVFNAGQYYPDWRYMGLLVGDGDTLSARAHRGFQAALVARSRPGHLSARVLDLTHGALNPADRWDQVAQSFMLFDRLGDVRVRRSGRIANRTVVAEDDRGRLVILVSEGGYTIADFADLLLHSPLHLTHAMSMDGGLEAELVVANQGFRYASFGEWTEGREPTAPGAHTPLPAVITLEVP